MFDGVIEFVYILADFLIVLSIVEKGVLRSPAITVDYLFVPSVLSIFASHIL